MHITVVGTGYVGLVTGAALADFGLNVSCVDSDERKMETLSSGRMPFYETGLEELVNRNLKNGRLAFSTDLEAAARASLTVFIAVGTPDLPDGTPDLGQVDSVVAALAECMDDYKVVVTKSTVPVGTARRIQRLLASRQRKPVEFDVVSNPEFLREGSAVEDFMRPNRVVIGAECDRAAAIVKDIYRPLYLNETPFVITSLETAELIKYACNAFLATKISFINEMANLCENVGADVHHVARAMGLDDRIGPRFLQPGPGFGGSCFPKDLVALARTGRQLDAPQRLAETVIEINQRQRDRVFSRIEGELGGLKRKKIGILGLAFKPNTDDIRGAPAIHICRRLLEAGARDSGLRSRGHAEHPASAQRQEPGALPGCLCRRGRSGCPLDCYRVERISQHRPAPDQIGDAGACSLRFPQRLRSGEGACPGVSLLRHRTPRSAPTDKCGQKVPSLTDAQDAQVTCCRKYRVGWYKPADSCNPPHR